MFPHSTSLYDFKFVYSYNNSLFEFVYIHDNIFEFVYSYNPSDCGSYIEGITAPRYDHNCISHGPQFNGPILQGLAQAGG